MEGRYILARKFLTPNLILIINVESLPVIISFLPKPLEQDWPILSERMMEWSIMILIRTNQELIALVYIYIL